MSYKIELQQIQIQIQPKKQRVKKARISIWGKSKQGIIEKIDACLKEDAEYLIKVYRIALYGWVIWAGRKQNCPIIFSKFLLTN